jgi:hypothetical protein
LNVEWVNLLNSDYDLLIKAESINHAIEKVKNYYKDENVFDLSFIYFEEMPEFLENEYGEN